MPSGVNCRRPSATSKEGSNCSRGDADILTNLGNAHFQLRRVDEAIADFRRALEIDPGHAQAHYDLGNALAAHGQLREAIEHYRKSLESKPGQELRGLHQPRQLAGPAAARSAKRSTITARPWRSITDHSDCNYNLGRALAQ